jgi:hypothetical protein
MDRELKEGGSSQTQTKKDQEKYMNGKEQDVC